jgi:hypothetical protein
MSFVGSGRVCRVRRGARVFPRVWEPPRLPVSGSANSWAGFFMEPSSRRPIERRATRFLPSRSPAKASQKVEEAHERSADFNRAEGEQKRLLICYHCDHCDNPRRRTRDQTVHLARR